MSVITANLPVQWLPVIRSVTVFDVTVTIAPSTAPVCYGATDPAVRCQP